MSPARDQNGRFVKGNSSTPSLLEVKSITKNTIKNSELPPVVDVKVSNPLIYIKLWWKKIMSGEGISIRIHPFTVILIVLTLSSSSFFFGRYIQLRSELLETYLPQFSNISKINAGFTGKLYLSEGNYYLTQGETQSLLLKQGKLNLLPYVNQFIFISGKFDPLSHTLHPTDIQTN